MGRWGQKDFRVRGDGHGGGDRDGVVLDCEGDVGSGEGGVLWMSWACSDGLE